MAVASATCHWQVVTTTKQETPIGKQVTSVKPIRDKPTNRPTDRPTDRPTGASAKGTHDEATPPRRRRRRIEPARKDLSMGLCEKGSERARAIRPEWGQTSILASCYWWLAREL